MTTAPVLSRRQPPVAARRAIYATPSRYAWRLKRLPNACLLWRQAVSASRMGGMRGDPGDGPRWTISTGCRSEERSVGQECVGPCRTVGWLYHEKKKNRLV